MPRVKRGNVRRAKRKKLLARAKGFYQTKSKLYRYVIDNGPSADPFQLRYSHHVYQTLDIAAMNRGAEALLGRHDFHSFETNWPNRTSSVRTIYHLKVCRMAHFVWVDVEADVSGTATSLRDAASAGLPDGLDAYLTGPVGFQDDVSNAFAGADFRLLLVTVLVVAVLLIVTCRSPVLWIVPLVVVGVADFLAGRVVAALAEPLGVTVDASISGILSVLVFGAGPVPAVVELPAMSSLPAPESLGDSPSSDAPTLIVRTTPLDSEEPLLAYLPAEAAQDDVERAVQALHGSFGLDAS